MSSSPGAWPRGFGAALAAGLVMAVAYAFWPQAEPPTVAVPPPVGPSSPLPAREGDQPAQEWVAQANAFMDHGQFAEAEHAYTHALEKDSTLVAVWVDRGACLHAQGLLSEAESDFRRALRLDPSHVTAHFNLGIVQLSQGARDSAWHEFDFVMKQAPGSQEAEKARSIILSEARP